MLRVQEAVMRPVELARLDEAEGIVFLCTSTRTFEDCSSSTKITGIRCIHQVRKSRKTMERVGLMRNYYGLR